MRNRVLALSVVVVLGMSVFGTTGCARLRTGKLMSAEENSKTRDSGGMKDVSDAEADKLASILTGEVQTVYPSDNGLARVYGQVANLGQKRYEKVKFDLVAVLNEQGSDTTREKVVGTFTLDKGLSPGEIQSFDVQTAASMGDVKNLLVKVSALK